MRTASGSLNCSGYVDGAKWMPPKDWDPAGAMGLDFGGDQKPIDSICTEVAEGVFERRFQKLTVRLGGIFIYFTSKTGVIIHTALIHQHNTAMSRDVCSTVMTGVCL